MTNRPYYLTRPLAQSTSTIFASPHSGRHYSWRFLKQAVLNERVIRSSEDAFVDQLYNRAPDHGAPLLASTTPRAYVDLNRGAEELDPALVEGVRQTVLNPRVSSGLGVIPRVVAGGRSIYHGKIDLAEAQARLKAHWHPYHQMLTQLVEETCAKFGEVILIDCHSMPREAVSNLKTCAGAPPEVVLGDRYGASAAPHIVDQIEEAFKRAGFRTARNTPFAGAYTAQHYGRPSRNRHVVQIELDRSLYMDERTIRPSASFQDVQAQLASVIAEITEIGRSDRALAAE